MLMTFLMDFSYAVVRVFLTISHSVCIGVMLNYSMVGLGRNIVLRPAFVSVLSGRLWLYYRVNVNASKFLCDAYTIHIFIRCARHGHKLSGKLKRIAQQEDQR